MTDNERKLRRQHQDDRDIIASLNRIADQRRVRIGELLSALELAKSEAAIRRDMYAQLCQGLGRKPWTLPCSGPRRK